MSMSRDPLDLTPDFASMTYGRCRYFSGKDDRIITDISGTIDSCMSINTTILTYINRTA